MFSYVQPLLRSKVCAWVSALTALELDLGGTYLVFQFPVSEVDEYEVFLLTPPSNEGESIWPDELRFQFEITL